MEQERYRKPLVRDADGCGVNGVWDVVVVFHFSLPCVTETRPNKKYEVAGVVKLQGKKFFWLYSSLGPFIIIYITATFIIISESLWYDVHTKFVIYIAQIQQLTNPEAPTDRIQIPNSSWYWYIKQTLHWTSPKNVPSFLRQSGKRSVAQNEIRKASVIRIILAYPLVGEHIRIFVQFVQDF